MNSRSRSSLREGAKVARSLTFFAAAIGWLFVGVGPGTRVVLWPLIRLRPHLRERLVGSYARFHARFYLRLARVLAGVRFRVHGQVPPEPCIVVMNHQSIFDIPLLLTLIPERFPHIPTRERYARGIPGVSPLIRLSGVPLITQRRENVKEDLARIAAAADEVARGEALLAIYPEGHRTRDGQIGPFMVRGLRTILERARERPVYCVVADGMWGARTFKETAVRMAGSRIRAVVLGPFAAPRDPAEIDAFMAELRERMVAALAELRALHQDDAPRAG